MFRRSVRPLILGLAALAALAGPAVPVAETGRATLVGTYRWSESVPNFGGFSGLEVADDGLGFTTISDKGRILTGRLVRDGERITGVEAGPLLDLRDSRGDLLAGRNFDSEGLAIAGNGDVYVSYEGNARIARHPVADGPAVLLPRPGEFRRLQGNSALEALAVDDAGRLYTIPERSGRIDRPFPVFVFANGSWSQPFAISRSGDYLVVGADFGPDGRLYVLERDFTGVLGFRSRVRRFEISGGSIAGEETVLETPTGRHGNLEGLAVWQDDQGAIRLTMIADDNFRSFLSTEFVEYRLN